jgi:hypothetical protein
VPLTGVTGWLRRQPGVRQAFPPPALEQLPAGEPTAPGASAA